jgi:hypothetical protein
MALNIIIRAKRSVVRSGTWPQPIFNFASVDYQVAEHVVVHLGENAFPLPCPPFTSTGSLGHCKHLRFAHRTERRFDSYFETDDSARRFSEKLIRVDRYEETWLRGAQIAADTVTAAGIEISTVLKATSHSLVHLVRAPCH